MLKQFEAVAAARLRLRKHRFCSVEPFLVRLGIGLDRIDRRKADEAAPMAEKPARAAEMPPGALAQQVGVVEDVEHLLLDLALLVRVGDGNLRRLAADRLPQVLVAERELSGGVFDLAFVAHDVEPQPGIELVDNEGGFEIARQVQYFEVAKIDVALDKKDFGRLLAELCPVNADGGVLPAE